MFFDRIGILIFDGRQHKMRVASPSTAKETSLHAEPREKIDEIRREWIVKSQFMRTTGNFVGFIEVLDKEVGRI